ncbi:Retrovirus-related Pol polyprotein from type-1 retrotransposable element R1 [Eumeta japonica]|uniref:Retrovirus-related Pol polyprotein from type-1 retrotransposable element R1 n=1 Tax=Eumeta variegata TaxID=151549 RepID=A0A4C1VHF5_EUMVA|nr:Retrovirus-related Pol polyprotein from type-1 retrotransposable element R1 [Eumeta japonica]
MDIHTASDRNAILWEISCDQKREWPNRQTNTTVGWKIKIFDPSTLIVVIDSKLIVAGSAEEMTKDLLKRVTHACDASELITEYKNARRELNKAIKDSKRCWEEFINEVDKDPLGRPYKVVMTHLKNQPMPPPTCQQLLQNIVTALFPQQRKFNYLKIQDEAEDIPSVTHEELKEAYNRAGNNKAPGLDAIPNIALKTFIKAVSTLFHDVFKICLKEGTFPRKWKQQRLVLLSKGKKNNVFTNRQAGNDFIYY